MSQALERVAVRLALAEKAVHFLEQRQDISNALPSEIRRHTSQFASRMEETTTDEQKKTVQAEYDIYKTDTLKSIWRRSCFEGCLWWYRLPRKL